MSFSEKGKFSGGPPLVQHPPNWLHVFQPALSSCRGRNWGSRRSDLPWLCGLFFSLPCADPVLSQRPLLPLCLALSWAALYTVGIWGRLSSHFGFSGFPNRNCSFHFNIASGEIGWTLHFWIRCKVGTRLEWPNSACFWNELPGLQSWQGLLLGSLGLCIDRSQVNIPWPHTYNSILSLFIASGQWFI